MNERKITNCILGILCIVASIIFTFDLLPIQNEKTLFGNLYLLLACLFFRGEIE